MRARLIRIHGAAVKGRRTSSRTNAVDDPTTPAMA